MPNKLYSQFCAHKMRNKEKDPVHGGDILGLLMEGKLLLIGKLHTQCGTGEGEP